MAANSVYEKQVTEKQRHTRLAVCSVNRARYTSLAVLSAENGISGQINESTVTQKSAEIPDRIYHSALSPESASGLCGKLL